jgi:hypothetical protein
VQNFSAVMCGCFVHFVQLSGEGFDLALARGELGGLCSELSGCDVGELVVFILRSAWSSCRAFNMKRSKCGYLGLLLYT